MSKNSLLRHFIIGHGARCHYCGEEITKKNATVDHITPKSKGGTNNIDNLALCCKSCNSSKGEKTVDDYRLRVAIKKSKWINVLTTPQVKMLLDDGHDIGVYPDQVVFYFEVA